MAPQHPSPAAEKAVLRRRLRDRLASVPASERSQASRQLRRRLEALPELRAARRLLVCLSFGAEPDTWPLVDALLDAGREVYVPRAVARDTSLHLHRYPCPLTTLAMGLRQPAPGVPELDPPAVDGTLDLALVLGLGFDRTGGYRLGHGRGYFDRFLAGRSFPKVGLALEAQMVERLPVEPHDVPMQVVVTEAAVYRFDRGG